MTRGSVRRAMRIVIEEQTLVLAGGTIFMAELTDAAIDPATERSKIARLTGPRVVAARYGQVIVELTNGCSFAFPPRLVQVLETATDALQAGVRAPGRRLRAATLLIQGLLTRVFGTGRHTARRAGRATSPANATATRMNGVAFEGGAEEKGVVQFGGGCVMSLDSEVAPRQPFDFQGTGGLP